MQRLALTGRRGSGKTSLMLRLAEELRAAGVTVGGIAQPVLYGLGERQGYALVDIKSGLRQQLARRPDAWSPGERGFVFEPAAWTQAARYLTEAVNTCFVCLVDELGLLEAEAGAGHLPAVRGLIATAPARLSWVFSLRQEVASELLLELGIPRVNLLDIDASGAERCLTALLQRLAPATR